MHCFGILPSVLPALRVPTFLGLSRLLRLHGNFRIGNLVHAVHNSLFLLVDMVHPLPVLSFETAVRERHSVQKYIAKPLG